MVLVAGSMGPTGEILEPLGPLSAAEARESFAEQAAALARGGADILWIETMSSAEETEAAIEGARRTGLPIVTTLSFDTNGRTMMGITPAELAGLSQQTSSGGLRQQLRRGCGGTGCFDRQSRSGGRPVGDPRREGELRHTAIRRRRDPIQRHARTHGRVRPRSRSMRARGSSVDAAGPRRSICAPCAKRSRRTFAGPSPRSRRIEARLGALSAGATAQLRGEMDRLAGAAPGAAQRRPSRRSRT